MTSGRTTRPQAAELAAELRDMLGAEMGRRRMNDSAVSRETGVNRQTIGRLRAGGLPDLHTAAVLAEWCGRPLRLADPES